MEAKDDVSQLFIERITGKGTVNVILYIARKDAAKHVIFFPVRLKYTRSLIVY